MAAGWGGGYLCPHGRGVRRAAARGVESNARDVENQRQRSGDTKGETPKGGESASQERDRDHDQPERDSKHTNTTTQHTPHTTHHTTIHTHNMFPM